MESKMDLQNTALDNEPELWDNIHIEFIESIIGEIEDGMTFTEQFDETDFVADENLDNDEKV